MPNDFKTYIVNDQPTNRDTLDFTPYVETLADIAATGNTPLTIGVFGTWGSGKTSLMRMIKTNLPENFTVAWFDAWKYDKEETLWRAFLLCVLSAIKDAAQKQGKPTEEFEKMQSLLYREMELEKVGGVTIDLPKLGGAVATGLVKLSLSFIPGMSTLTKLVEELQSGAAKSTDEAVSAITRERTKIYIEKIQFLEQFQERFAALVKTHIAPNRLVVFVDDLDRCLPEKAIEVLEAIKLFLDAENCIFVLGLDQEVIARGIEMKYKELGAKQDGDNTQHFTVEGVRYLEKIIQLPFHIPPVEQADIGDFVHGLSEDWPHEECPKVFAEGLGDNPRQIKRTVNTFLMLWKLSDRRKAKLQDRIKPIRLAKVVAIQTVHPDLYNLLLKDEPRYLGELEEYYRSEGFTPYLNQDGDETEFGKIERSEPPPALVPFLSRRGATAVKRILTMHKLDIPEANFAGLPPDELRFYFTLTARAETPQTTQAIGNSRLVLEPQMVKIPGGRFSMGTTTEQAQVVLKETNNDKEWQKWIGREQPQHIVDLPTYFIGKYPITNHEYQIFVRDTNYQPPQDWDGDQFPTGKGSHPVSNVSWNDATNYCEWLSKRTGKYYRLPTEAEWEKAARGEGGYIYPWGNEFDQKKANIGDTQIGGTTEVGRFSPQGDSPYGCADMTGNVWEWCNNWFNEQEYKNRKDGVKKTQDTPIGLYRVLRGGAFNFDRWNSRCTNRYSFYPDLSDESIGFRVVFSSYIADA